MMPLVISPSPSVNAESGISSPRRTRSMIEKSVVVRTPRFWQFSIDALDVFGDDQLDAGAHLGVGRLLPGRPFAAALSGDRGDETTLLDRSAGDRELVTALESEVGEFPQRLVVVVADVGGRDLVGRDVV